MQVRLLGPIDVVRDGVPAEVPGLRSKALLAALALSPRKALSADRLIDVAWDGRPPAGALATLQSHLSRLRRLLGDRRAIIARHPGYLLNLGDPATDVGEAESLIDRAAEAADPAEAVRHLQDAVALWRDRPLADLHDLPWFAEQAQRLEKTLFDARHRLVDLRLGLGQHAELIAELEAVGRQHRWHEPTHGQLMLALYRAGRQADALAVYERLRRTLDDELAITPSRPVRDLHTAILRQDPALDGSGDAGPPAPAPEPAVVPALLPPATAGFTGRGRELAVLAGLLERAGDAEAAPVIAAISGTAGVGKTALAVHWAHRVRDRFPDGQLYVNLRGYEPSGAATDPAQAIRVFLDALGVPPRRIPSTADAQAVLYRSLLAGKRVLVLLDNARDAQQVRPLLPATAGCLAIVTSRNHLAPLVAAEGARPLVLGLLAAGEARDLLARRLGADRVAAEPEAVAGIIGSCARLPLALAVVAARAATHPGFPLAAMAAEFARAAELGPLHAGDPASDVRAVFFGSYRALSAEAARLFRLLGIHPGPDLSAPAAAGLAGLPPAAVPGPLAELVDAGLLTEHMPNRYTFHDLLRAYAVEQAHRHDDEGARREAVLRMTDHYLHTAYRAALLLFPGRQPIALAEARPGVTREDLRDRDDAQAWFGAEHRVLLAVLGRAAGDGLDAHAWRLAWSLTTYLNRGGFWTDQLAAQRAGLAAARRLDDHVGQAEALRGLGKAAAQLGLRAEAAERFQQSAMAYAVLADPVGEAHAYLGLVTLAEDQRRPADMLRYARRALALYRAAGHEPGIAAGLNAVGWSHAQCRDFAQAVSYCTEALASQQRLGDLEGQANSWDSLGYAHDGLGDHTRAIVCYRQGIDLYRRLGDHHYHAASVTRLGDCLYRSGDHGAARAEWRLALDILDRLHHPDAAAVRDRLTGGPREPGREVIRLRV